MSKIVINNQAGVTDQDALALVMRVMQYGMTASNSYCLASRVALGKAKYAVYCRERTKEADPHSFTIANEVAE